jgi:S1-C subfamily serine protease
VWLVDEDEQNIVEADWREYHKRLVETDDLHLAAVVFFRAAENLL